MNFDITPIHTGAPVWQDAVSICLYDSTYWNPTKHLEHLQAYAPGLKRDILIFADDLELVPRNLYLPHVHIYQVNQELPGYCKHFYRYLSSDPIFAHYRWVWFTGSDCITDSPSRAACMEAASALLLHFVCHPSPLAVATAGFRATSLGRALVRAHLRQGLFADPTEWHCDDFALTRFFELGEFPILHMVFGDGFTNPQLNWFWDDILKNRKPSAIVAI
jgi:hypothetical protein